MKLSDVGPEMIDKYLDKLMLAWMACLVIVALFALITLLFFSGGRPVNIPPGAAGKVTTLLAILAAVEIGLAIFLDFSYRSERGVRRYLAGEGMTSVKGRMKLPAQLSGHFLELAVVPHYFQACLIRWALVEVVAIYGLMISIFTHNTFYASLFYVAALVTLVTMRPGRHEFDPVARLADKVWPKLTP